MKRIIFLNRFFFPDYSATSQLLSDLAFHLAHCGHQVRVITSRQRYDAPEADLPGTESKDGVDINRLSTTRFGRASLLGRGVDHLSFYLKLGRAILASAQPGDILVAMTDPPLLSIMGLLLARRRGLHLVNWLQDLYPEVAVRLGVPFVKGPAGRGLSYLRDRALQAATANVVVGRRMADNVRARGVSSDHIHVIPNWCDDEHIRPLGFHDNPLLREWDLKDRFVIGYSGNLGKAHEIETILSAANRLRNQERMLFLMIGGGSRVDELVQRVKQLQLERLFRFIPYQERARLKFSLSLSHVHWLSLRPELEGLIVPSKFYGIAAAGRPIVAITAADGEIANLVRKHDCGTVIAPGDGEALAGALAKLAGDADYRTALGQRARQMLDENFTQRRAFQQWRDLLESIE
jgi:glycosyltransferase involved in cell wall biosynthesis